MKAQTLIFEQVLLFLVSVAIFIMCFFVFQTYQGHFSSISMNDQVKGVRDLISSNVLELARFGEMNASVRVRIPERVSGERYRMSFSGYSFNVSTELTKTYAQMDFSDFLSSRTFSGNSTSSKGEVVIYKRGSNIILG